MSLKLHYKLWRERRELSGSRVFQAELRNKLSMAWEARYGSSVSNVYAYSPFKWAAAAIAVVVLMGTFGASVYAYNSPEVAEGTMLYPLKKKMEDIEESWQKDPESKAKFYLKKISRREAEEVVLLNKGRSSDKQTAAIGRLEEKLRMIEDELNDSGVKDPLVRLRIKEQLQKRRINLERRIKELNRANAGAEKEKRELMERLRKQRVVPWWNKKN